MVAVLDSRRRQSRAVGAVGVEITAGEKCPDGTGNGGTWAAAGLAGVEAELLTAAGLGQPNGLQLAAAGQTGLLRGASVVVLAATAAGKTGVGLMGVVRAVAMGRIGVILVPTRALADEVYRQLGAAWMVGRTGERRVRVALTTGEHSREDGAIRMGRVDVVVAVYEKFRSLLGTGVGLAARLGCVVADEIHLVADGQRGPAVDMMLTGLAARGGAVQLIGLGGAVEDGSGLAGWLGAECLVWRQRPGVLREGTLCLADGWFCHRGADGMTGHGLERLLDGVATSPEGADTNRILEAVGRLAQSLAGRGENLLVFVPTRRLAREWACWLSAALAEFAEAAEPGLEGRLPRAYAALGTTEDGHGRRLLLECGRAGVGFHSGDLPAELRRAVEKAFGTGELQVLVSTPTLAEGVNLGCRNVLVIPPELVGAEGVAGSGLDRRRLANMGGRAGRDGDPGRPGRAMVLVRDRDHAAVVWQDLLEARGVRLEPADTDPVLEAMALEVVAGAPTPVDAGRVADRLLESFVGLTRWACAGDGFARRLSAVLDRLEAWGLLTSQNQGEGGWLATATGQIAAHHGLAPATAQWLAAVLPQWPAPPMEGADGTVAWADEGRELALLLLAAQCAPPGDGMVPAPAVGSVRAQGVHHALAERLGAGMVAVRTFGDLRRVLPAEELAVGVRALLGQDWVRGESVAALEARYRIFAGALSGVGMMLARGLNTMASLAAALGVGHFPAALCADLAARLPEGLPGMAAGLTGLTVAGVSRTDLLLLAREGFDSLPALEEAQPGVLEYLLDGAVARALRDEVRLRLAAARCFPAGLLPQATGPERSAAAPDLSVVRSGHFAGGSVGAATRRHSTGGRTAVEGTGEHGLHQVPSPVANAPDPDEVLVMDSEVPGEAWVQGRLVHLSPLGFHLLRLLATRPGQVVSYGTIRETLWRGVRVGDQQVRFHKRRLVQALEPMGAGAWIQTRHGHGLVLRVPGGRVRMGPRAQGGTNHNSDQDPGAISGQVPACQQAA